MRDLWSKYRMTFLLLVIGGVLMLSSCKNDRVQAPDVSHINGNFDWIHFEDRIQNIDPASMKDSIDSWKASYPNFWNLYVNNVLGFQTEKMKPSQLDTALNEFFAFEGTQSILQDLDSVYNDFSSLEKSFERAFQYAQYYFPEKKTPMIFTCYTEFGIQRFLFSEDNRDAIGVGLDLFLGKDYPYREMIPDLPVFSDYLTRTYNEEHLVKKCLEAWIDDWIPKTNKVNLLNQMIQNGKKIYVLDKLLPYTPDSIILEYTSDQMQWVQDNELQMWAYLLKNDLFYSKDINKIHKLVNPSPTSTGMPEESPGQAANYLGWKIVEAYMKKKPETSLSELLSLSDAQKILEISRFKPKRK